MERECSGKEGDGGDGNGDGDDDGGEKWWKASIAASFWALLELRVGEGVWKDAPLTVTVEVKRGS